MVKTKYLEKYRPFRPFIRGNQTVDLGPFDDTLRKYLQKGRAFECRLPPFAALLSFRDLCGGGGIRPPAVLV